MATRKSSTIKLGQVRRLGPIVLAVCISAAAGMAFPLISGFMSWHLVLGGACLAIFITLALLVFESRVYAKVNLSLKWAIALKALVYATVVTLCFVIMTLVARNDGYSEGKSLTFQSVFTFSLVVSLIVSSVLSVSRIMGQNELIRLVIGHYHEPREEERLLMFLDLAGSTAIAEKIGAVPFFRLLNDFFSDLMDPVLDSYGEVYKYVGDEVIVTWQPKRGLAAANCIECYFAIEAKLQSRVSYYNTTYGVVPEFRAGLHLGPVVIGEMGDFKREIAILGDTVNSTARIASEAAQRGKALLVSEVLQLRLEPRARALYAFEHLGEVALKGKERALALLAVTRAAPAEPGLRGLRGAWRRWFGPKAEKV